MSYGPVCLIVWKIWYFSLCRFTFDKGIRVVLSPLDKRGKGNWKKLLLRLLFGPKARLASPPLVPPQVAGPAEGHGWYYTTHGKNEARRTAAGHLGKSSFKTLHQRDNSSGRPSLERHKTSSLMFLTHFYISKNFQVCIFRLLRLSVYLGEVWMCISNVICGSQYLDICPGGQLLLRKKPCLSSIMGQGQGSRHPVEYSSCKIYMVRLVRSLPA